MGEEAVECGSMEGQPTLEKGRRGFVVGGRERRKAYVENLKRLEGWEGRYCRESEGR